MTEEREEYTVFLRAISLGRPRPVRREIHFVETETDEGAVRKARELTKKLRTWDTSWLWDVEVVLAPDRTIIFPLILSGQRQEDGEDDAA